MEIKIDLERDGQNSNCYNKTLDIFAYLALITLVLEDPHREIAVKREDLEKVLSII